jgi:hypothetical protein
MCHMSLLTCPPLAYYVANLTKNGQMNLVIYDQKMSNEHWPNWPSEEIMNIGLFDQVMSRWTLRSGYIIWLDEVKMSLDLND